MARTPIRALVLVVTVLSASCGGPTAAPVTSPAPPVAPDPADPVVAPAVAEGTCLATPEATEGTRCLLAGPSCPYDGGYVCACGEPAQCGGEYLPAGDHGVRQCTAPSGTTRADGCLFDPPRDGAVCAERGRACSYPGTCPGLGDRIDATCDGTTWTVDERHGLRPP